ncbi:hypothetical protein [Vibrio phage VP16T]|nr:hypothetical protein [Vibrio phage VP16T]
MYSLLEVFANIAPGTAARVHFGKVVERILRNEAPTQDDISTLVQHYAFDPIMTTLDLQDVVDELNSRFGTNHTMTGR